MNISFPSSNIYLPAESLSKRRETIFFLNFILKVEKKKVKELELDQVKERKKNV